MKLTSLLQLTVLGLVLALAGAGCKHRPPGVTPLGTPGATTGLGENTNLPPGGAYSLPAGEAATGIPANPANAHDGWTPHPDILQADTVYFDFDSSVIKAGEQSKLSAVADYLKNNPSAAVRIEGHCDERGTEEYNRSLGERRALALREALAGRGVDPTRVDTVSFGKDRPADPGHNEAAWSKNRRGEFVVLTPP
jgi:peptidoglycan-associated lipoprotein